MKKADAALTAEIAAHERAVWNALVAGDAAADAALIDEGFLGVYPSGFANRVGHVEQLASGPSIASFDLSDISVRNLAPDLALIAYRAGFARSASPDLCETMFVSSIWARRGEGWINVFSQDTPAV